MIRDFSRRSTFSSLLVSSSQLTLHGSSACCCSALRFTATAQTKAQQSNDNDTTNKAEDTEALLRRLKKDTDREIYEPGPIAKVLRKVIITTTSVLGLRKRVAKRMEKGLKEVARLEDEAKWLRSHGSPLRVLGLPESADLDDVRNRYRNLLFEVHPDTAPREDSRALVALGLTSEQARARQLSEFELLQTAFKMATTPTSLWHQDGNAPTLLRELQPNQSLVARVLAPQNLFPIAAYIYMFCVLFVVCSLIGKMVLDAMLHWTDPDFYAFMYEQEKEERRKREAGEVVDTDPKRLSPEKMMRITAPGKFLHTRYVPDEDDPYWDE